MISDVLYETLTEIERYEREMPDNYGTPETVAKILETKLVMRSLLSYLDTPPNDTEQCSNSNNLPPGDAKPGEKEGR